MEIKRLQKENLEDVLRILHQDTLRYADGDFPGPGWVGDLIESEDRCFAFGLFDKSILVSVLLAEKLVHKGCILWYIATDPEKRSLGFGGRLFNFFEEFVKNEGLKWIFLNATEDSLNFYKKHGFVTSKYSKVYEHVKYL
jgi:GNAT superfamily N-acetyltransferase